jgi:hypothetical protein
LVTPAVGFSLLTFLQRPLVLFIENKLSKRKIFLLDLLDPRIRVVDYLNALEFKVENLCEVDIVKGVRLVDLVFEGLGWARRRVVIVKREFGWREYF